MVSFSLSVCLSVPWIACCYWCTCWPHGPWGSQMFTPYEKSLLSPHEIFASGGCLLVDLYSALAIRWQASRPQGTRTWITQFNLPLAFVRIHQMLPPWTVVTTSCCSLLLIYRLQKDERLSWLSWLTYSGWLTHISGHPSAVGRVQDRENSPVKDQRSTTATNNLWHP